MLGATPRSGSEKTLHTLLTLNGIDFYYFNNTFYRQVTQGGKTVYQVVEKPSGVQSVEKLPADFEPWPIAQVTYFRFQGWSISPTRMARSRSTLWWTAGTHCAEKSSLRPPRLLSGLPC